MSSSSPPPHASDTEKMVFAANQARRVYKESLAKHGLTPEDARRYLTKEQANEIVASALAAVSPRAHL